MAKPKERKKPTGKEIAVVVISIIMVISILLPSFAQIFAAPRTSQSFPTSFDDAASRYQPQVDEAKAALQVDSQDAAQELKLADAYFNWASYVSIYAGNEDEQAEVTQLYKEAATAYASYIDQVGSLDTDQAKNASINESLSLYYSGNTAQGVTGLEDLAKETNYASAWANLAMMYESRGEAAKAADAYEKGAQADTSSQGAVKKYCEDALSRLRSSAAASSGGASALSEKLDQTAPADSAS